MKTYLLQPNTRTAIGRSGDTGVTVQFDALAWYTDYPAGLPYLMVTSPGGRQTPVTVTYADGLISGEVPDELLVRPGLYSYVFAWVSAGEQVMSSPCGVILLDGVNKRWEPHSAAPDWADRIFLAAESIEQRVNGAIEAEAGAQDAQEGAEAAQDAAEDAVADAEAAQAAAEAAQAAAAEDAGLAQSYANAAAESASQAMSGTPEGYADLVSSVGDLKSAKSQMPLLKNAIDSDADLDVVDIDGSVILRLENGEIQTKKFDSTALRAMDDDADADLDISDQYGHVLARFEDGNAETRNFRGYQYKRFATAPTTYTGEALTLTISQQFRAGDRIVLHVERGATPWNEGGAVTYYVGSTDAFGTIRGDNAWMEFTLTQDANSVSAIYAASATGVTVGDVLTFEVYLLGDIPIRPTVVKVKQDGTGDFTTLRGAIDFIGLKADDVINPYVIELYPGTYNVMDDYTAEEINAAEYHSYLNGFVGPLLLNGVSLVGVGPAYSVIINGFLDTATYSSNVRGQLAPINTQGSVRLENLTIRATNMRYCVHDDYSVPLSKRNWRIARDCIFEAYGEMGTFVKQEWGGAVTYPGSDILFENCQLQHSIGIHNRDLMVAPSNVVIKNCKAHRIDIHDYDSSTSTDINFRVALLGCALDEIESGRETAVAQNPGHIEFFSDTKGPVYLNIDPHFRYVTGDVAVMTSDTNNLTAGDVVRRYSLPFGTFVLATSADDAQGVVIMSDNGTVYVQTGGIVRNDRIGISGTISKGDYIGMDSSKKAIVVSSSADAIGRVIYTTSAGLAYIKLNWRLENE